MADSSADNQIFSKHASWTLALLVAAPALYVLTAPWICGLAYWCKVPVEIMVLIYRPLNSIAMSDTSYGHVLEGYLNWCNKLMGII